MVYIQFVLYVVYAVKCQEDCHYLQIVDTKQPLARRWHNTEGLTRQASLFTPTGRWSLFQWWGCTHPGQEGTLVWAGSQRRLPWLPAQTSVFPWGVIYVKTWKTIYAIPASYNAVIQATPQLFVISVNDNLLINMELTSQPIVDKWC